GEPRARPEQSPGAAYPGAAESRIAPPSGEPRGVPPSAEPFGAHIPLAAIPGASPEPRAPSVLERASLGARPLERRAPRHALSGAPPEQSPGARPLTAEPPGAHTPSSESQIALPEQRPPRRAP
ncbi:hypothetical protein CYMTET_35415, partial [Cymbomonas tetramitiformis]